MTQVSQEGVLCRVREQGWVHEYKYNTDTLKGKHRQRNDKQTQKKHGWANRKLIVHLNILLSAALWQALFEPSAGTEDPCKLILPSAHTYIHENNEVKRGSGGGAVWEQHSYITEAAWELPKGSSWASASRRMTHCSLSRTKTLSHTHQAQCSKWHTLISMCTI